MIFMVVGRVLISFLHKSSNNEMLTWANQWHLMTKNGICSLSLTEWHLMAINKKSRLAI